MPTVDSLGVDLATREELTAKEDHELKSVIAQYRDFHPPENNDIHQYLVEEKLETYDQGHSYFSV